MDETLLRKSIGENISHYRKQRGMTQSELGALISYSDKSVSKWERGEGLPDVTVISALAEIFEVTANDLIYPRTESKRVKITRKEHRLFIPLLACAGVWLLATAGYLTLHLVFPEYDRLWVVFLFAVPVCCAVGLIFLSIWWGVIPNFITGSVLIWTLAVAVWPGAVTERKLPEVYLVAAALQILLVIGFIYVLCIRKKRSANSP